MTDSKQQRQLDDALLQNCWEHALVLNMLLSVFVGVVLDGDDRWEDLIFKKAAAHFKLMPMREDLAAHCPLVCRRLPVLSGHRSKDRLLKVRALFSGARQRKEKLDELGCRAVLLQLVHTRRMKS